MRLAMTAAMIALAAPVAAQDQAGEIALLRAQLAALEARLAELEARGAAPASSPAPTPGGTGWSESVPAAVIAVPVAQPPAAPSAPSRVEDESDPPPVAAAQGGARLTVSGQVNQMLLLAEQGGRDQVFVADNDGSGSRIGFTARTELGRWTAGAEVVISAEVNSSDAIDFGDVVGSDDDDSVVGDFRQANLFVEHPDWGFLSIGQGDTAAARGPFSDLSGTGFAGADADVDDIAGGLSFVGPDGPLDPGGDAARLDRFFAMLDDSRDLRVFYRSPEAAGATAALSLSSDEDGLQPAVGASLSRDVGAWETAASLDWRREDLAGRETGIATASASVLAPSGVSFGVAAALGGAAEGLERPHALFAKIGYRADLLPVGETAFSLDLWRGRGNPDFAAADGTLPLARSAGLFAVQTVEELNTEFYAGTRVFALDDVVARGAEVEVDDLWAVLVGAWVSF